MGHYGKTIRALRKARHWNLEQMAAQADLGKNTISKAERQAAPEGRGSTYRKIARVFGMTVEELDRHWREAPAETPGHADLESKGETILAVMVELGSTVTDGELTAEEQGRLYALGRALVAEQRGNGDGVTGRLLRTLGPETIARLLDS